MDVKAVHEMIGLGFRLGLHGHQHYAATAVQYLHEPDAAMAIVGAGSLCAGGRELPRGIDRQYNVVVLNDTYSSATVHVREMGGGNQFNRTRRGAFGVDGAVRLKWTLPTDTMGRPIDSHSRGTVEAIDAAEAALGAGDSERALLALERADWSADAYARQLYLKAAQLAKRWDLVVNATTTPANADELVLLITGLEATDVGSARGVLAQHADRVGLSPYVRRDIEDRLEVREKMRV